MMPMKSFPDDLPWGQQQALLLLDGATVTDLPAQLKQLNPAAITIALFNRPPFVALEDISPLLVPVDRVDEPLVQFFLAHAHEEWGALLFSTEAPHDVAEHLRKLLTVETPDGHTVLLRLADAAVMRALFDTEDPQLTGPLTCAVTADSRHGSWQIQRPIEFDTPTLQTPYRLSAGLDAALTDVDQRRVLLDLDAHLLAHFPDQHVGDSVASRWPALEQCQAQAQSIGLSTPSELLYYANVMAWLDGDSEQHPQIHQLLHTPSLQSPGERVALAAALAYDWAIQRGRP
ncbi:DUF4123 domain-containing protein [Pseudomonas syringae]|nr:DUF4123 domain-containing protein [Pseudomonas syringae]MCF5069470.1 DUF4123 domain-containing protein [Pseudomonas syringae]